MRVDHTGNILSALCPRRVPGVNLDRVQRGLQLNAPGVLSPAPAIFGQLDPLAGTTRVTRSSEWAAASQESAGGSRIHLTDLPTAAKPISLTISGWLILTEPIRYQGRTCDERP